MSRISNISCLSARWTNIFDVFDDDGSWIRLELVASSTHGNADAAKVVLQKAEKALSDLFNTPSDGST